MNQGHAKKNINWLRQHRFTSAIAIVLLLFILFFGIQKIADIINTPKNLGRELQFIGKETVGGPIFPFIFYSDSNPYTEYYYATDLSAEDLQSYFTHASKGVISGRDTFFKEAYSSFNIDYVNKENESFTITFFNNTSSVIKLSKLKDTGRKHVIAILAKDYSTALRAIE